MDEYNPISEYEPIDTSKDQVEKSAENADKVKEEVETFTEADASASNPVLSDEEAQSDDTVKSVEDKDHEAGNEAVNEAQATEQPSASQNSTANTNAYAHPYYQGYPNQNQPYYYQQQQFGNAQRQAQQPPYANGYNPQQPYQPQYNRPQQNPQQAPFNPAQNQYGYNPYAQQQYRPYPYPQYQKPKTPKKTKVFIGILIALLVLFFFGFIALFINYVSNLAVSYDSSDNPLSQFATEPDDFGYFDDYDDYDSFAPFGYDSNEYDSQTFKEEIVLTEDTGQTQDKSDDMSDNSAKPDKDAKGIVTEKLPKDKHDDKHTTQSAYNAITDSVVSIVCYEDEKTDDEDDIIGEGTGTIVSSNGYIVTNSHVIGDSKAYFINVVLNSAKEYRAKVVGYDTRTDLAVIKIDAKDLKAAKFGDSSLVNVGQDIVAVGSPGGKGFQNSLTRGIVSAVGRSLDINKNVSFIQIDAAINPGNSGGPLCNIYGQVIGINTAKISSAEFEGMGFAIESNIVSDIANDLIHYGYVKDRVRLGLSGREVSEDMTDMYSNVPNGVLVVEIDEDGPLADTDIKPYDIITAIDGEEVYTFQDIYAILEEHKPGDKITLDVFRLKEK